MAITKSRWRGPGPGHGHDHGRSGALIVVGDTIHNFLDGILIAAAFLQSTQLGIVTALAIVAHEIPQEVGDFLILLNSGYSKAKAFLLNMLSSCATLVGGVLGYHALQVIEGWTPMLLGIVAASAWRRIRRALLRCSLAISPSRPSSGPAMLGGHGAAGAPAAVTPDPGDRRFAAKEWNDNPYFSYLRQSYLLASSYLEKSWSRTSELEAAGEGARALRDAAMDRRAHAVELRGDQSRALGQSA